MTTYRVKPSGKKWIVTKNGGTVSHHRKKSAAKRKAKRKSSGGDKLVIHGANGRIQDQRRRRS